MSKRNLTIGAVVMVALFVVFIAIRDDRKAQVSPPKTNPYKPLEIQPIEELARVVIAPSKKPHPLADGSVIQDQAPPPDKIVLEKRGQEWWITAPIEGRVKTTYQEELAMLFAKSIGSDDVGVSRGSANDPSLWLSPELSTRVEFHSAKQQPALTLLVGKQVGVPGTREQRTFVKEPGSDQIHRLQASLGFLTARDPLAIRSTWAIERSNGFPHHFDYIFADNPKRHFVYDGERWGEEGSAQRIDQTYAQGIAGLLGGLQATSVFDGVKPESLGFVSPGTRYASGDVSLTVWTDGARYFAIRGDDRSVIFEIPKKRGQQLLLEPEDFKSRVVRPLDPGAIAALRFPGEDGVVVEKVGEKDWRLIEPVKRDGIAGTYLDGLLKVIATIRAERYVAPALEQQGLLDKDVKDVLEITMSDGTKHRLLVGKSQPPKNTAQKEPESFARFADKQDEVFVLSGYLLRRLRVDQASLDPTSQQPSQPTR